MELDRLNTFADNVALSTAATGRQVIGDQIDMRLVAQNIGAGRPAYIYGVVTQAFTSGGAATVDFEVVSDATAALATDGSSTRHLSTGAIPVAQLTAGRVILSVALPQGAPLYERFLGIVANVATAALTAGRVDFYLTYDPPDAWQSYPDAVN
jgi:hypothetical protein